MSRMSVYRTPPPSATRMAVNALSRIGSGSAIRGATRLFQAARTGNRVGRNIRSVIKGTTRARSKSANRVDRSDFDAYAGVSSFGSSTRYKKLFKKRRLTRKGRRRVRRWKKFSKKVSRVQYNNLGTKQIAWETSFFLNVADNAPQVVAFTVFGNSSGDGAGVAEPSPYEDDIRRILVSANLEPSEGFPTTANKAVQQMFLKGIGCDIRITAGQATVDSVLKPFAPFILECFTIRAKHDISCDDIDHTGTYIKSSFLNYYRTLWSKSAEATGIKTTPISGATADAILPTFNYNNFAGAPDFAVVGREWVPYIFSNFGRHFVCVKRQKFYFQNIGDYFEFKFGKKMFTRITEGYWFDKMISKKYTTIYLFKATPAIYNEAGTNYIKMNFEITRHASWSKEGDTIDATALV